MMGSSLTVARSTLQVFNLNSREILKQIRVHEQCVSQIFPRILTEVEELTPASAGRRMRRRGRRTHLRSSSPHRTTRRSRCTT